VVIGARGIAAVIGDRSRAARWVEVGWLRESAAWTAPLHVSEWS
jgi:hypothetical protein